MSYSFLYRNHIEKRIYKNIIIFYSMICLNFMFYIFYMKNKIGIFINTDEFSLFTPYRCLGYIISVVVLIFTLFFIFKKIKYVDVKKLEILDFIFKILMVVAVLIFAANCLHIILVKIIG